MSRTNTLLLILSIDRTDDMHSFLHQKEENVVLFTIRTRESLFFLNHQFTW